MQNLNQIGEVKSTPERKRPCSVLRLFIYENQRKSSNFTSAAKGATYYVTIACICRGGNLLSCKDIMLFSRRKMSCFRRAKSSPGILLVFI